MKFSRKILPVEEYDFFERKINHIKNETFTGRLVHLDAPTGSPRGAINTEVPRNGGRRQEPREPAYSVERPRGNQNQWNRGRP